MENANRKGPIVQRGQRKKGIVVSDRSKKTVIVELHSFEYFPKYKRFARSKSRIHAHNPETINAKLGDEVEIAECRKISKTKAWTVARIIKSSHGIVVIEKRGGRALEEEAERLKKSQVIRDEIKKEDKKEDTERENEGS